MGLGISRALNLVALLVGPDYRRQVGRSGEIVDDGIKQRLYALRLVGSASENRVNLMIYGLLANGLLYFFDSGLLAIQDLHHYLVIVVGQLLKHLATIFLGLVEIVGRDGDLGRGRDGVGLGIHFVLPMPCDHLDQIDDTAELLLGSDGYLDGYAIGAELLLYGAGGHIEVRADGIQLVYVDDGRNVVLVGLTPNGFGLGLDAVLAIQDGNSAIQDTQRTLDLSSEVDVSRSIDQVDAVQLAR